MKNHTLSRVIKKEIFRSAGFMVIFLTITGIGVLAWSALSRNALDTGKAQVKNNLVCMVNDTYFGTEQIPVVAEGKTYYGCCQDCIAKIQNNRSVRYARDPYSGTEVDKANAFIVKRQGDTKEVLYFESKENFKRYLTTQTT